MPERYEKYKSSNKACSESYAVGLNSTALSSRLRASFGLSYSDTSQLYSHIRIDAESEPVCITTMIIPAIKCISDQDVVRLPFGFHVFYPAHQLVQPGFVAILRRSIY